MEPLFAMSVLRDGWIEMTLFNCGRFQLHSGQVSDFKIDCDHLTEWDWQALAREIIKRVPWFGSVEGVPTGGLELERQLRPYATGDATDPLLIVDDVYTTGGSMETHRAGRPAIGVVVFARQAPTQDWIRPLFLMSAEKKWKFKR